MNRNRKFGFLLLFFGCVLLLFNQVALGVANKTCLNNNTLETTTIFNGVAVSVDEYCVFGCVNNDCVANSPSGSTTSMWLTFAIGCFLTTLGFLMGLPFGKFAGEEKDIRRPFNTLVFVRYLFFFVGIFLIYLSMGMANRIGAAYGNDTNVTNAMNSATFVMLWTIILFLILFALEFTFTLIKWLGENARKGKWGDRDLDED